MPEVQSPPTVREAFERRLYLRGITDREAVERLWAEDVARREAAAKAAEEKRKTAKRQKRTGRKKGGKS